MMNVNISYIKFTNKLFQRSMINLHAFDGSI